MVALQISLSFDGDTYLVLTTEIKNVDEITNNIYQTKIIKDVVILNTSITKKSAKLISECVFGIKLKNLKDIKFDEFVGFNFDLPSHAVFAEVCKNNPNICVNKMEEGLLSYNEAVTSCKVMEISYLIRRILRKKNLRISAKAFYCFSPEVYKGDLSTILIPKIRINDRKILKIFNTVFLKDTINTISEKYIFLPSIYDIEGGEPIGELELAEKIANKVGIENIIVKVHPRDNEGRYLSKGFKIDVNKGVPWEIIQMNMDLKNKVIITTLSGGVLNFNTALEESGKSYYAYKLCDLNKNSLAKHYRDVVELYLREYSEGLREIYILDDVNDL